MHYSHILYLLILITLINCQCSGSITIPLQKIKKIKKPTFIHNESIIKNFTYLLESSDNKNSNSSTIIKLKNFESISYKGPVQVGNQDFIVIFDTGSADFWLMSDIIQQQKHNFIHYYNRNESDTWASIDNTEIELKYGKGECKLITSSDVLKIGNYLVHNQRFGETITTSNDFIMKENPIDGILGLGYNSLSALKVNTVMDSLKNQGIIKKKIFSFHLTKDENQKGSTLLIGDNDLSLAPNGLTYVPLTQAALEYGTWFINLDTIFIGSSTNFNTCSTTQPCTALIDTGTSFIGIPSSIYLSFINLIIKDRKDCQMYLDGTTQCSHVSNFQNLPDVTFTFSNKPFTLKPSDYLIEGQLLGFSALEGTGNLFIMGDIFIKTCGYVIFDMEENQVGLGFPREIPLIDFFKICIIISIWLSLYIIFILYTRYKHNQVSENYNSLI